jgi:hypothetical protein
VNNNPATSVGAANAKVEGTKATLERAEVSIKTRARPQDNLETKVREPGGVTRTSINYIDGSSTRRQHNVELRRTGCARHKCEPAGCDGDDHALVGSTLKRSATAATNHFKLVFISRAPVAPRKGSALPSFVAVRNANGTASRPYRSHHPDRTPFGALWEEPDPKGWMK